MTSHPAKLTAQSSRSKKEKKHTLGSCFTSGDVTQRSQHSNKIDDNDVDHNKENNTMTSNEIVADKMKMIEDEKHSVDSTMTTIMMETSLDGNKRRWQQTTLMTTMMVSIGLRQRCRQP